jgi:acetyl-CoA acetyltransferase family protein
LRGAPSRSEDSFRLVPRAVVLSAVRTPVGRYGGALAGERPDDLAATVIAEAVSRAGVPADEIEDVYFGAANQAGEDNRNVARMAALLAGLPESVAGVTVNRLCASGLSAVVSASHAVVAGDGDLFVAGGVESMTRAPLVTAKSETAYPRGNRTIWDTTLGWRFPNPRMEEMFPLESMGETGENVAERYGISREEQDDFGLRSHRRWTEATDEGRFDDELVPVGDFVRDEHPRPDTSAEKLATLKPAFREGGAREGLGRRAAGRVRRQRGGGSRSPSHGHRPRACGEEVAPAGGNRRRRPRPRRVE